jgi:hypothetical protein
VQALADGKDIEYKDFAGVWSIKSDTNFSDEPDKYRIKPEPREWIVYRGNTALYFDNYEGKRFEEIIVREVIE